jgi:hypothetical protein
MTKKVTKVCSSKKKLNWGGGDSGWALLVPIQHFNTMEFGGSDKTL